MATPYVKKNSKRGISFMVHLDNHYHQSHEEEAYNDGSSELTDSLTENPGWASVAQRTASGMVCPAQCEPIL